MSLRSVATTFAVCLLTLPLTANAELPANTLTDAETRTGWKLLFDGRSTKGWRNYKAETVSDGWKVEDGAIVWSRKQAGDIITDEQYEFFELALEYKISTGGNSGIMFHVQETEKKPWQTGPEIQVQDNVDGHDPQKSGWLYQLYKPGKDLDGNIVDSTRPAGEWNHLYVRIWPNDCEICMNGLRYSRFQVGSKDWNAKVAASKFSKFPGFGKAGKGHICLQDHGNVVAFRNIKVRPYPSGGEVQAASDELPVKVVEAFPGLEWAGWDFVTDAGKVQKLRPIVITHAGESGRIYTATQTGMVHSFSNESNVASSQLVMDIRDKVANFRGRGLNEEGLLGLAFHPKFSSNKRFFVCYSTKETSGNPTKTRIAEYRMKDDGTADEDSETVIIEIDQPFHNHNGGAIAFGPDGHLYIGMGDGGYRNDPHGNGQNLGSLLGSILRIDINGKSGGNNYAIPADNPFVNTAGARPEIYAYGVRNIWRLSFDRETGKLWAADVGQELWEEINIIKAGGNYGWSLKESNYPFGNRDEALSGEVVDPVYEYDHRVGKSITGGFVYRGKAVPELIGKYIYADYVTGRIWALDTDSGQAKNYEIPSNKMTVLAFGEDADGEIYYSIPTVTGGSGIFKFQSVGKQLSASR